MKKLLLFVLLLVCCYISYAQSDTWVCTDGLNRIVSSSDSGLERNSIDSSVCVGMFYYVWHGQHGTETYDITQLLKESPLSPQWGDKGQFHWGSKPLLNYYKGGDRFVISKHMQMLMDAGVDFYFFDVTNAYTYDDNVKLVMDEIDRREVLGLKTPKLAFSTHSFSAKVIISLYNKYYANHQYDKYWFYWKGKPLVLANEDEIENIPDSIKQHFSIRYSWAWQEGKDRWPWLAHYPQKHNFIKNSNGKKEYEQVSVSVSQHPYSKIGKSFHKGKQPDVDIYGLCPETPYGYYFAEQWSRALELHPKVVMVTQWNEWMAQRFVVNNKDELPLTRPGVENKIGETYFVDVYNAEFNRDIEPSAEPAIRDNYYLQLVDNVRKFKGCHRIPIHNKKNKIKLNNRCINLWNNVMPTFADAPCDTYFTSATAQDSICLLRPSNDIVCSKITYDKKNLYFYVEVNGNELVPPTLQGKETWMNLLLDIDQLHTTGWEGYDYRVMGNPKQLALYRYNNQSKEWIFQSPIKHLIQGNKLMFSINRKTIDLEKNPSFDFKWIDNTPSKCNEILDFYRDGDTAPNARFNYRFKVR